MLKNELAAGTLPCGRFGANAAWWRLNALVHNLLQLLKATALPAEMRSLRPKALRFRLFNLVGVITVHARRLTLQLSGCHPFAEAVGQARESLIALARAGPATA